MRTNADTPENTCCIFVSSNHHNEKKTEILTIVVSNHKTFYTVYLSSL